MMQGMRNVAAHGPENTFAFESGFLEYETDGVILSETLFTLIGSFGGILVVLLLMFWNVVASLIVIANVFFTVFLVSGSL